MEKDLFALVERAGIVGAGGAGFPAHVKLKAKADTVIINGAECEPLLRVDQQLMAEKPEALVAALELIMGQVGAKQGIIALKSKYTAAKARLMKSVLPRGVHLHLLTNFYPAGDEQVLVYETLGRIVPEGGIPLNVGAVVLNVETALNVYQAAVDSLPVTDSYLTLTGAVKTPKTVYVPLGITVKEAFGLAGGVPDNYKIIDGGPMMGKVVPHDHLVTKTTAGLIALPPEHPLLASLTKDIPRMLKDARIACMQCSLCSDVCPRGLLGHRIQPHKLMRLAAYGKMCSSDSPMSAFLCCGCRLCEYACVMNLQPWKLNNSLKDSMGKNGVKNSMNDRPSGARAFRENMRYPMQKLIRQLGLGVYDVPAPLDLNRPKYKAVELLLKQHVGAPSIPVVKVGEHVTRGELIASIPEGKLGANLHASISGMVFAITDKSIVIRSV